MKLSEQQIDFLALELEKRGATQPEFAGEMLDHFCCAIEAEMESEDQFQNSFRKAWMEICPDGLEKLNREVVYVSLSNRFKLMKKLVFIIGFISGFLFVVGYTFKTQHWPTANVQIMLGTLLFVAGFLPSYLYMKFKHDRAAGKTRAAGYYFLDYGLAALMAVFTPYKIMHWPGSNYLFLIGLLVLAFVFLPKVFFNWFRKFDKPDPAS